MKKNQTIFLGWFLLVILWNVWYEQAAPWEDILAATILSILASYCKKKL